MMAANQQGLKESPLLFGLSLSRLQLESLLSTVPAAEFSLAEEEPLQQRLLLLLCRASVRSGSHNSSEHQLTARGAALKGLFRKTNGFPYSC